MNRFVARIVTAWFLVTAGPAAAEQVSWSAPESCPGKHAFAERVRQRSDVALDETALVVSISIAERDAVFAGRLEVAGTLEESRTLESASCEELADALAIVVARLASLAVVRNEAHVDAPSAAPTIAAIGSPSVWNGGARVGIAFGAGRAPEAGFAGDIGGWLSWREWSLSISASRWTASSAMIDGTMSGVDVGLTAVAVRVGARARSVPLRAWLVGELGSVRGTGIGLRNGRVGHARWTAAGAGVGWAVPLSARLAAVASVEAEIVMDRAKFTADGVTLFRSPSTIGHGALTLEMSWR